MKVFYNHPTGGHVGGLIIVAARSPEEAHGAMCAYDDILTYYYEPSTWRELEGVTASTETPCVLAHGEHEG